MPPQQVAGCLTSGPRSDVAPTRRPSPIGTRSRSTRPCGFSHSPSKSSPGSTPASRSYVPPQASLGAGPKHPDAHLKSPSSCSRDTSHSSPLETGLSPLSTTCQCLVRPVCALPPSLSSHLLSTREVLLPRPLSPPLPETPALSLCGPHPTSCPSSCSQWTAGLSGAPCLCADISLQP